MLNPFDIKLHLMVRPHSWSLRMRISPSLSLLSGPVWPWVVGPVIVPSMGQIELFNHLLGIIINIWFFFVLSSKTWKYLSVCMLHSLHNGFALLYEYKSTRASDGVHPSAWHNHLWYHLRSGQIVTTPLASQLPIK